MMDGSGAAVPEADVPEADVPEADVPELKLFLKVTGDRSPTHGHSP